MSYKIRKDIFKNIEEDDEVRDIIAKENRKYEEEINNKKHDSKKRAWIATLIMLVILFCVNIEGFNGFKFAVFILYLWCLIYIFLMRNSRFDDKITGEIYGKIIKKLNSTFLFLSNISSTSSRAKKSEAMYSASQIVENAYDEFDSPIEIIGRTNNSHDVVINKIQTEIVSRDSDGNSNTTVSYSGLFGYMKSDTSINVPVCIRKNNKFKELDENRIEVESNEFESYFDIISTDKVFALEVITPELIEIMEDVRRDLGYDIEFSIVNDYIYFKLYNPKAFWVSVALKNPINEESIFDDYKAIRAMINIMELLNNRLKEI